MLRSGLLNSYPFRREVNEGCLSHNKTIQINRTQFAAHISFDKKLKDQSGAVYILFFFTILHDKSNILVCPI